MNPEKKCAYPGCKNQAQSRGKRKEGEGYKRFKWCGYHRRGKGRAARLELTVKEHDSGF